VSPVDLFSQILGAPNPVRLKVFSFGRVARSGPAVDSLLPYGKNTYHTVMRFPIPWGGER